MVVSPDVPEAFTEEEVIRVELEGRFFVCVQGLIVKYYPLVIQYSLVDEAEVLFGCLGHGISRKDNAIEVLFFPHKLAFYI